MTLSIGFVGRRRPNWGMIDDGDTAAWRTHRDFTYKRQAPDERDPHSNGHDPNGAVFVVRTPIRLTFPNRCRQAEADAHNGLTLRARKRRSCNEIEFEKQQRQNERLRAELAQQTRPSLYSDRCSSSRRPYLHWAQPAMSPPFENTRSPATGSSSPSGHVLVMPRRWATITGITGQLLFSQFCLRWFLTLDSKAGRSSHPTVRSVLLRTQSHRKLRNLSGPPAADRVRHI